MLLTPPCLACLRQRGSLGRERRTGKLRKRKKLLFLYGRVYTLTSDRLNTSNVVIRCSAHHYTQSHALGHDGGRC